MDRDQQSIKFLEETAEEHGIAPVAEWATDNLGEFYRLFGKHLVDRDPAA